MLRSIVPLILFGLGSITNAATIDLGGRSVEIPIPDGFVELTPEMPPYYESMAAYVGPNNVRYLTLVRSVDAEALLRGESIELHRYLTIETEKGLVNASISSANFEELRELFVSQLDEIFAAAGQGVDDMLSDGNDTLSESFGTDVEVEVGGIVPLPVHQDEVDKVAFSTRMNVGANIAGQSMEPDTIAGTTLVLHVLDKVLFLYVYGDDPDLDWTRNQANEFADAILAANPMTGEVQDARQGPGAFGINWGEVMNSALIGAATAGGIALLAAWFRNRRRRDED